VRRDRRPAGPCSPRRAVRAAGLLCLPWPAFAGGAEDGTLAHPGLSHAGAQERPGEAAAALRAACVSGDALLLEGLWRDLRGLATRTEIEEWDSRPTITRCAFLVDLVAQRAFRPGIPVEERLEQHYERLARVRSDWGLSSPRAQTGAAELYGRHPDLEFDDRGLVYLRMGEPDEIAFAYAGVEGDMGNRVEGWRYDDRGGPRVFFFHPSPESESDCATIACSMRSGGPWGTGTRPSRSTSSVGFPRPRCAICISPSRGSTRPMLRGPIARRRPSGVGLLNELPDERKAKLANVAFVVDAIPDAPFLDPSVRFSWERLRFFNPASGEAVA
jgi:hypothetical protein